MSKLVFKNYGGSYQLRIQGAGDLENVLLLDETRWAATSVPIRSLNCDDRLLAFVDTDRNGRIRTDEIKAAVAWLFKFLSNRGRITEGTEVLTLSDIDTSHTEGRNLRAAAERILSNLNLEGQQTISLTHVRDVQSIMSSAANNGDGIIPPDAASKPDIAEFITSVMQTVGSLQDCSGKAGIGQEELDLFFKEAEAYLSWKEKGDIAQSKNTTEIMPWGDQTPQAYEVISSLQEKVDEYFTQCAMVRLDERIQTRIMTGQGELKDFDFRDKSKMQAYLKDAPLAVPNPKGILDLETGVNPSYFEQVRELKEKVLKRALGLSVKHLTHKQWQEIKTVFAPYRAWLESKKGERVEKLGEDLLRKYLNGAYKQKVSSLIAKDAAVRDDLSQIQDVEKLILYQRWLLELANNFVSLSNLYNPRMRSLIEMGTLVIDGRQMTFTVRVYDRAHHKKIAQNSNMCLLYLEVTGRREDKDAKFEIVAAVTSGTIGRLRIGKRGVFFTVDRREWDAEVVDIVENPISIWESVRAPFNQIADFIRKQVDKFADSRQAKIEQSFSSSSASGITRDLLLGGGVAIAALGSAFAYVTKALSQVKYVHILGVIAAVALVALLPATIVSFLKIRKRDMSVILEASGWAVNVLMRLNASLGRLFTHVPALSRSVRTQRKDLIGRYLRELGCAPLRSGRRALVILIIIFILLVLILAIFTYPSLKPLF